MGVVSPYISDDEVVSSLRGWFDATDWYRIDFHYWLSSTARVVRDGVCVNVGSRCFIVNVDTGNVIREVKDGSVC